MVMTVEPARVAAPAARRIRVAQCIHGLQLGGAQQVVKYIARCGDKSRFEYFVYASLDGAVRREIRTDDAIVRIIPRHVPKLDPVWLLRLARTFRRDRIDLVHTHLFGDSLHGYYAARLAGNVPVVMTLHSVAQNASALQARTYRHLIRKVNRAVACSPSSYLSYTRVMGAGVEIGMIPNGLAADAIDAVAPEQVRRIRAVLGANDGQILVGAVGRLVEAKGYHYLISAFRRLRSQIPAKLALVGTGPLESSLRDHARSEGVADDILFAGFRDDTRRLVWGFDIVAFSSLHEGIPLALLEAMATSRCVVATAVPSIIDVVENEKNSLLVPAREPEALANALRRAATSGDLRAKLGAAARARFEEEFTAERMTERYEAIYRTVAESTCAAA
jgi:glycosyltransferase involved in cell wall biosynthesis